MSDETPRASDIVHDRSGVPRSVRRAGSKARPHGATRRERKAWAKVVRIAKRHGARLERK